MLLRLLPALLLTIPAASGQSIYGTATAHPRAGDPAPDLAFSQVLSSPAPGSSSQPNLSGQFTVLAFFPDTSHNPKPVADWNARVDQFASKRVQFIWITGEDKRTLLPALAQHPIKGWVLYDPDNSTAKAFGLDMPVNTYIGPTRKIIGFQQGYIPDALTLNAVLEGRIALTRPTPSTLTSFRDNNLVALDSTPPQMPKPPDLRPHITPSYTLHITPSTVAGHHSAAAGDYLTLQGFTLREAVERIYELNSPRIELPPSVDTAQRYDFALLLPHPEPRDQLTDRFKQGLQDFFHLTLTREPRLIDVYVLSLAPGHKLSLEKLIDHPGEPGGGSSSVDTVTSDESGNNPSTPQALDALFGISVEGTMDDLCSNLESVLDRPVVNETHLEGRYQTDVHLTINSNVTFVTELREKTGLHLAPGRRSITFLKFKSVNGQPAPHVAELH